MPAALSKISTSVFHSAASLPANVWNAFESDPHNSNVIYSHALKSAAETDGFNADDQVWIVCTTGEEIDFVLSCTHHPLGDYPIFIYCARPCSHNTNLFITPRMRLLADELHRSVDTARVFSVFSLELVTRTFASIWSQMTQISYDRKPYYAAKLKRCTRRSLQKPRQPTILPDCLYELRLATVDDIPAAAVLCHGFATEAEPFSLSIKGAKEEATILISQQQLWVHTIQEGDKLPEIASIVAVTRESASVAAITKVYTNPRRRSRGCAERLVRRATQSLLASKESVILYVAHLNPAANGVYNRVGFVELSKSPPPTGIDGVDSWLELGFDRSMVALGHW